MDLKLFILLLPLIHDLEAYNPSRSIFAPKISVLSQDHTGETLDINTGSDLHLKCTGRRPLVWMFPSNNNENSFVMEYEVKITARCDPDPMQSVGDQCWSEMTVASTRFDMSGYYVCHYNNTKIGEHDLVSNSNSNGNVHELSNSMDQLYVFVNDPDNLIVPYEGAIDYLFIALFQSQPATIPCRPSYSTARVTLWKTETKVGKHLEIKANASLGVLYDPRRGFYFSHPRWDNDANVLECRFAVSHKEMKATINIHFSELPKELNPIVDDSEARRVYLGDTFILKCLVHVDLSVVVVLDWDYPANNATTKRIVKSEVKTERTEVNGHTYETASMNLTVHNASQEDAGMYRCHAFDGNTRTYTVSKRVPVFDGRLPTSISFLAGNNTSPVQIEVGQSVHLTVQAKAFPDINLIDLSWYKNNQMINVTSGGHYEMEIYSESVDHISLRVMETTPSDSGLYTLVGNSTTVSANISFAVLIIGDPEIIVNGTNNFYVENNTYRLACNSFSFPVSTIWWQWLACDSIDMCLNKRLSTWTNLTTDNRDNPVTIDNHFSDRQPYLNISILRLQANRSGIFRCLSRNVYGLESQQIPFTVMDGQQIFNLESSTEEPTLNETIIIKCKANRFEYEQVWLDVKHNKAMHQSQLTQHNKAMHQSQLTQHNTTNRLSLSSMVTIESAQYSHSGVFTCFARRRKSDIVETQELVLNIRDVVPPVVIHSNLANNVIEKVANEEIELKCNVTGFPTPKVVWHRDGGVFDVQRYAGIRLDDHGQRLVFMRLLEKDSGRYECLASNRGGSIRRETYLKVVGSNLDLNLQTSEVIATFFLFFIGALLLMFAVFIGKRIREARQHKQELEFFSRGIFENGQLELFNPDLPLDEQIDLLPYDARYEFPKENLELGATLGQGAFGRVVKANAFDLEGDDAITTVAVKMLKEHADFNQRKALIAELKILIHLGRHLNIVNLLGAVTKNLARGELLVIVEYCEHGNLKSFLMQQRSRFVNQIDPSTGELRADRTSRNGIRYSISSYQNCHSLVISHDVDCSAESMKTKKKKDQEYVNSMDDKSNVEIINANGSMEPAQVAFYNHNYIGSTECCNNSSNGCVQRAGASVTTYDLICYTYQCARGMHYLTSRKLIHRDLAARNVLLTSTGIVKICDFGLAKDVYKYDNYVKKEDGPLPIKWMAIESIGYKVFTSKSDVWSFGILMWEIFTLGGTPYPGITIDEEFYKRLQNGYRLEKPEFASTKLYECMLQCWNKEPEARPTFNELSETIGSMLSDKTKQYYTDMNERYLKLNQLNLIERKEEVDTTAGYNEDYLKMSAMSSGDNPDEQA